MTAPLQATLVAWLGTKPAGLADLLDACRARLGEHLGDAFDPYAPEQVHATLIGLERAPGTRIDNANLLDFEGRSVPMDVRGYVRELLGGDTLPLAVRFGGFARGEGPFLSRNRSPWERSFSIQGDRAVLIGWPDGPVEAPHPRTLDALRRRAGAFGIRHAYHRTETDLDNDLYLRLGSVREVDASRAAAAERDLREILAAKATTTAIGADDLRVALYRDPTLDPATTRPIGLAEIADGEGLEALLD